MPLFFSQICYQQNRGHYEHFDGRRSYSFPSSLLQFTPQVVSLIRPDIQYTFNSSNLLLPAIITPQMYSKERGILLHSQRISVLTHTLPLQQEETETLTAHASVFALMCFLTVTTGLAPSRTSRLQSPHSCSHVSQTGMNSSHKDWRDTCSYLSFQRWNFTRISMTWLWGKGWRAGSCTRRWRASPGTSPYWRWDFHSQQAETLVTTAPL